MLSFLLGQALVSSQIKPLQNSPLDQFLIPYSAPLLTPQESVKIEPTPETVVDYATDMIGTPYIWGAEGRYGAYDCSSWVRHVYNQSANIQLPRTAAEQAKTGIDIDRDSLKKGDLIFFRSKHRRIGHVGIYIDNGVFVHDSSAQGKVGYSNLDEEPYYDSHYIKAVRILHEPKLKIDFNPKKIITDPINDLFNRQETTFDFNYLTKK